jgi:hypothetical protein
MTSVGRYKDIKLIKKSYLFRNTCRGVCSYNLNRSITEFLQNFNHFGQIYKLPQTLGGYKIKILKFEGIERIDHNEISHLIVEIRVYEEKDDQFLDCGNKAGCALEYHTHESPLLSLV